MNNFDKAIHQIYDCRQGFILIGLTGRTGSGCSTAASILSSDVGKLDLPEPTMRGLNLNEERKYKVIYNFAKSNWIKFKWIKIKDVITSFIIESTLENFLDFVSSELSSDINKKEDIDKKLKTECGEEFNKLHEKKLSGFTNSDDEYKFYFDELPPFTDHIKESINKITEDNYTRIYQKIGNNIRSSGHAIDSTYTHDKIFSISEKVNQLIKIFTKKNKPSLKNPVAVAIAIDSLRNPFEALFFRERYSAFYLMAINTPDDSRRLRLQKQHNFDDHQIDDLDKQEYSGKKDNKDKFISQDIQKCYDLSDIHINNPQIGEEDYTLLASQLAKFVALIMHPGLIMPTSIERCMQIAHTAKLNSGCLSRQVGAAVTDENFSIKGIGWNTVAEGQTPCLLRDVRKLIANDDKESFSDYENNNIKFRKKIKDSFKNVGSREICEKLKGRNVSYCFKDFKNCLDGHKNQVHTRALHAEENAFLQITKYGGQGVLGGILFTTSSPCELCAKKAYQLGIKKVYYIDPYPGIANQHIISAGMKSPMLELFSGAIGRAYHQLYEPIIPYKDELQNIIGFHVTDQYKELEKKNKELEQQVADLKLELKE
ncbi:MAG: hypothetical protein K8R67_19060 [Desulfobacteraceae bacterium]|nr:hypothetical protein [Desulfobacteraceae bacterium]